MKNIIMRKLNEVGNGISFANLSRIDGFNGDLMYGIPEKNVYYWFSCSPEAIDALEELIAEGVIELKPTDKFVYFADGIVPHYPIARQNRHYVSDRWLPVVLNRQR